MTQIGIGELSHAKADRSHKSIRQEGQLSVDVIHDESELIVVCPIAGVERSELVISIQDDVLTIRGTRKKPELLENKTHVVTELFWGTFSRSILMPEHIDRKNIQAQVSDQLLMIRIPKTEQYKTRVIQINETT